MIPLYIVRHGETKLNNDTDTSQDRIRGWADVPLTDQGRKEAKVAANKLKQYDIEMIFCSDLSRAKETAEIIGKELGIKPTSTKELRPWNLGELTGTTTKDALPKIAEYVRKKANKKVPDGESFDDFSDRFFNGLHEIVEKADGKKLCVVTHHRDERILKAWVDAGCPADHKIDLDTFLQKGDPPGGVIVLKINEENLGGGSEVGSEDQDIEDDSENKPEESEDENEVDNKEEKEEEKPVVQAKKGGKPTSFGANKLNDVLGQLKQSKEPKEPKHHITILHIGSLPSSMLSALFGKDDQST